MSGDAISLIQNLKPNLNFKQAKAHLEEILGKEVILEEKESKPKSKKHYPPMSEEDKKSFAKATSTQRIGYRGIPFEADQFYGHRCTIEDGVITERYYPETNTDTELTGYKCRGIPKDFTKPNIGNTGITNQLSGQHKYKNIGGRYLLIVGGEDDKAAAWWFFYQYEMEKYGKFSNMYHVVSPTCGEGGAHRQVGAQIEFVDRYDNIIIGMDNDDAGIKAADKIAAILPKEKVKIARWSKKDPHKLLEDGMRKEFLNNFFRASPLVKSSIKSGEEVVEEAIAYLKTPKLPLPPHMHRIEEAFRGGIRQSGAIVNVIGDTSIGKTSFVDSLLSHWLKEDKYTPTMVSIERVTAKVLIDLVSTEIKKNLSYMKDGHAAADILTTPETRKIIDSLMYNEYGENKLYIYDDRDADLDLMKARLERCHAMYGSKIFIIDPLTDVTRSLDKETQDKFWMWEKMKAKEGWIFINVLHTRKPPPDKSGKVRPVGEYDAYGTSSGVQSGCYNLVINRDKTSEDVLVKNTLMVSVPKARDGITGKDIAGLHFHPEKRVTVDLQDYKEGKVKWEEGPPLEEDKEQIHIIVDESGEHPKILDRDTGEVLSDNVVVLEEGVDY